MKRPSAISWEQLKVGAMIIGAMLVMTVAVFKLGQAADLFSRRYSLVTLLPNAGGLLEGGQVTVAGKLAGTVQKIEFLPVDGDTTRNLRVTIGLNEQVKDQVRGDSRGKLKTMGLLGDKIIDISPGTPRYAPLRAGDTLQMAQSLDYEAVLTQAAGAVTDVVGLTHDLREITGGIVRGEGTMGQLMTNRSLYDNLASTLSQTNNLLGKMQNPNGTFGRLLEDPTLYHNMVGMIANVDTLMVQLNSDQGTMGKLMRDDSLYRNLVGITAGADSLMRLMNQGNGFAARMLHDQQLYDQLNKTVGDLNALLEDVRKNPKKYTRGIVKVF